MVGDGAVQRRALSLALSATALVVALTLVARFAGANGGDLPPQVLLQAFLKPEEGPLDTDLYWNQGFLDVELEYPITSPRADFSVRVNVAPELGQRVKLHLEFLPIGRPARVYDLPGRSWRMPLDPRWYEAAWTFARSGFVVPFALDRLVFPVCLAAPFRQFWRLLAVVMALTLLQGASLTASALGATPDTRLLTPLYETCVAAVVVLLAKIGRAHV